MTMNVFTYGSLMYPAVMEALTERLSIAGKKYPGIRHHVGSSVNGRVWFDLDDSSMRMLDCFEDPLYEKQTLEVLSNSRGSINASAYVVPKHLEHTLTDQPWDASIFENRHLAQYVEMCKRFRFENLVKCV